MMNLYNRERNNDRTQALANALQASRINTGNNITPYQPVTLRGNTENNTSAFGGAGSLLSGAGSLYKGLQESGLLNNTSGGDSTLGSAINDEVLGTTSSTSPISSAINNNVMGTATDTGALSSAISSEVPMLGSASGFSGLGLIGPAIGGLQGLGRTGEWQGGVQGMFGIDSENDSDVMQGLKGAGSGALTGLSVGGPIGAVIGGVLGLGSSFLDDI